MKHAFGYSQHRFTKDKLHSTNLIAFYDKLTCLADVEQALDVAYIDFLNIFNVVSLFLKKLMHCSLRVCAGGGRLTRHTHRGLDNISFSNSQPVTNAVPQESILGPEVFNLFILDRIKCTLVKFADRLLGMWTLQTGESPCKKIWIGWKSGLYEVQGQI